MALDGRYLIGKRQEIIVVIEKLDGQRIVLDKDVTGKVRLSHNSSYPDCHPVRDVS